MSCLNYATILAVAQGVAPESELMQIQAHLSTCVPCRQAIAGAARLSERRAPSASAPTESRGAGEPGPPPLVRWATVLLASIALVSCVVWKPPAGARALSWFENALELTDALLSATAAQLQHVWRSVGDEIPGKAESARPDREAPDRPSR